MAGVSYFTVGSNNLEKAKTFYDALMGSIGMFGVLGPYDGKPATIGNGTMGGFSFDTRDEVAAFHAKTLELGATCEGEPGERGPTTYFAYFRDPDGNKLCGYKIG